MLFQPTLDNISPIEFITILIFKFSIRRLILDVQSYNDIQAIHIRFTNV